jgi:glycosyltransferase involved in cell wall biosynthesis
MPDPEKLTQNSHIVSVIIPSIHRSTLAATQASLKNQTRVPDEIIVEFDRDRQGPGAARNKGFSKSAGDLIAFTNDDCVAGNDWLEKMIEAIDAHDADMVSGHFSETDFFLQEIRARRKFPTTTQINPSGFIGNTGNAVFKRECLEECYKKDDFIFNPIFGTHGSEDIDLVFRFIQISYSSKT